MLTNEEKLAVWKAYNERKPTRVPMVLWSNPRVVLLDKRWNPRGITFHEFWENPAVGVDVHLKFLEYQRQYLNQYCDNPTGWPEEYQLYVDTQNIYDAAYFGSPIEFRDGQIPDATPCLSGSDKLRIFDFDIDHPLENPFIQHVLQRYKSLQAATAQASFHGIKLTVNPPLLGFDGPLTIATCLRGTELFTDLYEDPAYARKLMAFIQRGVVIRNQAMYRLFGKEYFTGKTTCLADDSVQLISTPMYVDMVMPLHRAWYAQWSVEGPHGIHLCGDATRHYPTICRELNVKSFDTGFPVDHGKLRKELGPDVEIVGGVQVALLVGGTPEQVYARSKEILTSGVMTGGRFMFREGNNLPPCVPEANLAAMYRACLEYGNYERR
jgi:uroporphyrinogen-III decarboxylase